MCAKCVNQSWPAIKANWWNSKPNIAALGFILFTDSDIEYVASIPFKRIERCVGDIKAIPALWRLTKTLFKLNVDCIDETPAI